MSNNKRCSLTKQTRETRVAIGLRLRAAREQAYITVIDAASALDVQPLAIERWERGAALPSLVEFAHAIEVYGVLAGEVLFGASPVTLSHEEAAELTGHARAFSSGLRLRVDCLLAMFARGREPVWRGSKIV